MSEAPVQETASLHEKAVQAIARGDVQPAPPKRSGRRSGPPAAITTHHIKVDPKVMEVVREIIEDQENAYTRVEIRSETEVVVR